MWRKSSANCPYFRTGSTRSALDRRLRLCVEVVVVELGRDSNEVRMLENLLVHMPPPAGSAGRGRAWNPTCPPDCSVAFWKRFWNLRSSSVKAATGAWTGHHWNLLPEVCWQEFRNWWDDDIFTTNRTLFFNSLASNYPVDKGDGIKGTPSVWKVFSNELLSNQELNTLFSTINETHVINWKAYPEYDGTYSSENFRLHPGLYHINDQRLHTPAVDSTKSKYWRFFFLLSSKSWSIQKFKFLVVK